MFVVLALLAVTNTVTALGNLPGKLSIRNTAFNSGPAALANHVTIDILPTRWAETGFANWAGSTCNIYARIGSGQGTVQGTHSMTSQWQVHIPISPKIYSMWYSLMLWTDCQDEMLVDWIAVTDQYRRQIAWFQNDQYALCLSSNSNDHIWFNQKTQELDGYDMLRDGWCAQTMIFYPSGYTAGWRNWSPGFGRRTLDGEDLPTTEDVRACEQDDSKTEADCIALVGKIFDYQQTHPEGFTLEMTSPVDVNDLNAEVEPEPELVAAAAPRNVVGTDSWLVNVFAAMGLCFTLFGAFRHYTQK